MKARVLTALRLIPICLGAFFWSAPLGIIALAVALGVLGALETNALVEASIWSSLFFAGLGLGSVFLGLADFPALGLALGLIGIGAAFYLPRGSKLWGGLSALWPAAPLAMIVWLHGKVTGTGFQMANPALMTCVPLWAGDTAAIFAGKAFGKHLLAPTISPKKTWEGSIANLITCIAVAIPLGLSMGFAWPIGAGCGLIAGIVGQAGDLFESNLKRRAGVKDSGTLLPGHGGVLDRLDSVLFTAPLVTLVLHYVAGL